jgi:hypothetical protein
MCGGQTVAGCREDLAEARSMIASYQRLCAELEAYVSTLTGR